MGDFLPERAVVDMDTGIINNLEVCPPDIDPDHTFVTIPFVSNRALP